jgi:hypothetical protein
MLNVKFHDNPSSGSRVIPCGRTDRQDEANSRFRNYVNAPKMYFIYFLVSADTNGVATDFR